MTGEPPPGAPHSATATAPITAPEERAGYERAARWAGIRQRQATHDRATVVEAYFFGYLDGMREDAEGCADPAEADVSTDAATDQPADQEKSEAPTHAALERRARLEGYADGRRWRERGKLGGLVRLAILQTGKSARRFATEDLVRDHDKVRAWQAYKSNVPEVVADELLRRLHALRIDSA